MDSQSVSGKLVSDKIGYVSISSFDSDTAEELLSEVNALGETDGLIIDLRDNPGGLMNTAVKCVDMFIDGGNIVIARYREDEEIYTADKDVRFTMPVVVLVNENSASASEIFSAALKENDRAEIVGSTTYGKGSIQQSFMLPGNAGANITVGKFFSPDGNAINKVGVTPDYEVTLPDELKGGFASQLAPEEDTQLQKAIELLKKQ